MVRKWNTYTSDFPSSPIYKCKYLELGARRRNAKYFFLDKAGVKCLFWSNGGARVVFKAKRLNERKEHDTNSANALGCRDKRCVISARRCIAARQIMTTGL